MEESKEFHYKLDSFEGPLDLLLHLIDKSEVDIYNIPIREITDQYMAFLHEMPVIALDPTSEFLVMAATLLSIKSKMLLPKPPVIDLELEDEMGEDPRAELVQRLIEYRKFKEIADHLRDKELATSLIYSREPEDLSAFIPEMKENPVRGITAADLIFAFQKILKKSKKRETFTKIRRDEISVKDRIVEVVSFLQKSGGKALFSALFTDEWRREEIVVTFLSLLELMKAKRVSCYQHGPFDDIVIQYKNEGEAYELSTDEIDY